MPSITHLFPGGFKPEHYEIDVPASNPIDSFKQALIEGGLIVEHVNTNGSIQRCQTSQDKAGKKNGWYVYFDGADFQAGAFGNWKTSEQQNWTSYNYDKLTAEQKHAHQERMSKIKALREQDQKEKHEKSAKKANEIWQSSHPAKADHYYLSKKGVKPYGIRQLSDGRLIIPLINNDGELRSLEFVLNHEPENKERAKSFLFGSEKKGNYCAIGKPTSTIYICEGYSTGASVHEATNKMVICAMDCGNLKPVAINIRKKYSGARIIIAADNDQHKENNAGLLAATEASKMVGASVAIPEFVDLSGNPTDFNDLTASCGIDEVKKQLGAGLPSRINIRPLKDIGFSAEPIDWLIKGYIEAGSLTCLYARPATFKTFVMLDWALSLASGNDWKGIKIKRKFTVVYVNGEGQRGIMRRINAWCVDNKISINDVNFHLSENAASLFADPNELKQDLTSMDVSIDFIIFDTLNRNTPGMEENATKDMSIVISNIQDIQQHFDCAAAVLHHTPKHDPTSLRGSGALEGAIDSGFYLEKQEGNPAVKLACGKMKDGEPPEEIYIEGRSVNLGYEDEDGKQVSSLVMQEIDPDQQTNLLDNMKDKRISEDIIEFVEHCFINQLNISDSPKGNYLPKVLAKRLSGRRGGNWNVESIEQTMYAMIDRNQLMHTPGHNKSRAKTLQINEKFKPKNEIENNEN